MNSNFVGRFNISSRSVRHPDLRQINSEGAFGTLDIQISVRLTPQLTRSRAKHRSVLDHDNTPFHIGDEARSGI